MDETVAGRVDLAGKLISADPPLLRLQEQAGSSLGHPLAIPSLAGIARLSRTLGIAISRNVICADADVDVSLSVRAYPDQQGVNLAIGGWMLQASRQPWVATSDAAVSVPTVATVWEFTTNAELEIIEASAGFDGEFIGQSLSQIFRMVEDEFNEMPILSAGFSGSDFFGQAAVVRTNPHQEVSLSGRARIDGAGRFAGLTGIVQSKARCVTVATAIPPPTNNIFSHQLNDALRIPLHHIVQHADLIRQQPSGPLRQDYADYAGDIATAGRHLLALVDDLSDIHTVEEAQFSVETEDIDIADIARLAAGLLKVRAGNRGIRIDQPDAADVLLAKGDYRRILQILMNLIGNAIRYSPDEGMIWIRTERDAGTVVMIIADQGKGIGSADHQRIFAKFERVDQSEPGGSGLGLYISRRLAQAMSGDITVDSAPGQGARFALTLPAA